MLVPFNHKGNPLAVSEEGVFENFTANMLCSECLLLGRIVGFLFGFSLASSYAAYHLLEEYQAASAALQASVEELKLSTEKVRPSVYFDCHYLYHKTRSLLMFGG